MAKEESSLPEPVFLSSPKVATICGVTRNTVCCWIREGKLPSYRTAGGKNLIRPFNLVEFMSQHNMFIPDMLKEMAEGDSDATANEEKERTTSLEPAILVVDDDQHARQLVVRCLSRLGLPILEAETGYEALHLMLQRPEVALVVLDMVMPGQHGSKTFSEIRKADSQIPVIVVTGFPVEDVSEYFTESKPELILSKPFQPMHLLEATKTFLADIGI